MDEICAAGGTLLNQWTQHSSGQFTEFKFCKTTVHGDIWAPKEISDDVLETINEKGQTLAILNEELACSKHHNGHFFSKLALDRHNHLCLSLNRSLVSGKVINDAISLKEQYGCLELASGQVTIMNHTFSKANQHHLSARADDFSIDEISLTEARCELIMGLLARLLKSVGYSVSIPDSSRMVSTRKDSLLVGNLFSSFTSNTLSPVTPLQASAATNRTNPESFISSFVPSHKLVTPLSDVATGAGSSLEVTTSANEDVSTHCNVFVDARAFVVEHNLLGMGGYDGNIDRVQVTDGNGFLTSVAKIARDTFDSLLPMPSRDGHVIIHIARQQRSYHTQQAMILADMFNRRNNYLASQHIVLTSGVECLSCLQSGNSYPIAKLFRGRQDQMSAAYVVKYGEKVKGPHLSEVARQMAEAVVKFELLSHDPSSTIKIDVPKELSGHHEDVDVESDVRHDGAFVLYNYARLATLLRHHKQACDRGDYPPLPNIDDIDFSVLKEEEEWQLLFHFVLQYPVIVKEASQFNRRGVGVHLNIGLKKVCQFLVRLCHCFSSYYSRTKVLLPPEPNLLPYIHSRLYLMMSLKQTVHNALNILAIEPLEQL